MKSKNTKVATLLVKERTEFLPIGLYGCRIHNTTLTAGGHVMVTLSITNKKEKEAKCGEIKA
jgi:hypothetical protein